jgi:predicted nucleic acid-binding Zn ribbon protein
VCGISIAPTKDYCSDACRDLDEEAQKKMKNYRRLTLFLMVGALVVLIALSFILRAHG